MRTQWRAGWGPVGLDWPAVLQIARVLHIEMTSRLWHKLHALELDELEDARKPEGEGHGR